jgi:hypothetical protein
LVGFVDRLGVEEVGVEVEGLGDCLVQFIRQLSTTAPNRTLSGVLMSPV